MTGALTGASWPDSDNGKLLNLTVLAPASLGGTEVEFREQKSGKVVGKDLLDDLGSAEHQLLPGQYNACLRVPDDVSAEFAGKGGDGFACLPTNLTRTTKVEFGPGAAAILRIVAPQSAAGSEVTIFANGQGLGRTHLDDSGHGAVNLEFGRYEVCLGSNKPQGRGRETTRDCLAALVPSQKEVRFAPPSAPITSGVGNGLLDIRVLAPRGSNLFVGEIFNSADEKVADLRLLNGSVASNALPLGKYKVCIQIPEGLVADKLASQDDGSACREESVTAIAVEVTFSLRERDP